MDMIILVLAILLWIFTWKFGWRIMKWKNRKMALVMTVLFPYIGLLFALFLDQKCPHCGKCINMAADICPYCAKDIKTGKFASNVVPDTNTGLNTSPESEKKAEEAVCGFGTACGEPRADSEHLVVKVICENCGLIKVTQVRKPKPEPIAGAFGIILLSVALIFAYSHHIKLSLTTVLGSLVLIGKAFLPGPKIRDVRCPNCRSRIEPMVPCDSWAGRSALGKFGRKV